jgi:hypothetical protein
MMGPTTLAEIKSGLRAALARTGKDPIQWLEERIAKLEKAAKPNRKEIELLHGLHHVLGNGIKENAKRGPKPRPTRARRKSRAAR